MSYFLIGPDNPAKQNKLQTIKHDCLASEALNFDYDVLYGNKLDPAELKKSLLSLPAFSEKRFILIHQADKLSAQNQDIIKEFLQSHPTHCEVCLESSAVTAKDRFVKSVSKDLQVIDLNEASRAVTVFDMTRAMSGRRLPEALKILYGLIQGGQHPLQIMGGLVWFWGKQRERLSPSHFALGLKSLQEADGHIKRSRLKPDYAMECLVVKLYGLM